VRLLRRRKRKLRVLKLSKYELNSRTIFIHCISIGCSLSCSKICSVERLIRLITVLGGKEHGVNRRPLSLENWEVVSLVYCPTIWLFRYH
jgi:hypothetical protein